MDVKNLGFTPDEWRRGLIEAVAKGEVKHFVRNDGQVVVQLALFADAEQYIADQLDILQQAETTPIELFPDIWGDIKPDPSQEEALEKIAKYNIAILNGGPGTGKTTIAKTLAAAAIEAGYTVVGLAPTGIAALRLSQSLEQECTTIHRALTRTFAKDTLFLIDETSMLDVIVAAQMLARMKPGCRIVFIGDEFQLPSVGAGAFLRDILTKIPTAKLARIHRQKAGSAISEAAAAIKLGEIPAQPCDGGEWQWWEATNDDEIVSRILWLVDAAKEHLGCTQADCVVLAAQKNGTAGVNALNLALQNYWNPDDYAWAPVAIADGLEARPKDIVINNVNNYDLGIVNGEFGIVEFTDPGGLEYDVSRVAVSKKASGPVVMIVKFVDRYIGLRKHEAKRLNLGYATTVHKSQGNQWPCVIYAVTESQRRVGSRTNIYTALTRAQRYAIAVGQSSALLKYVQNAGEQNRSTTLATRLK